MNFCSVQKTVSTIHFNTISHPIQLPRECSLSPISLYSPYSIKGCQALKWKESKTSCNLPSASQSVCNADRVFNEALTTNRRRKIVPSSSDYTLSYFPFRSSGSFGARCRPYLSDVLAGHPPDRRKSVQFFGEPRDWLWVSAFLGCLLDSLNTLKTMVPNKTSSCSNRVNGFIKDVRRTSRFPLSRNVLTVSRQLFRCFLSCSIK